MQTSKPIHSIAFDIEREVHWGSDVESAHFANGSLVVRIAREIEEATRIRGIEISFSEVSAFRYLDEFDLARYWTSKTFVRGNHVLEITEGGWSDEENALQGFNSTRREWLVVTGNACMSVFSTVEPKIHELSWQRAV